MRTPAVVAFSSYNTQPATEFKLRLGLASELDAIGAAFRTAANHACQSLYHHVCYHTEKPAAGDEFGSPRAPHAALPTDVRSTS